MTAPDHTAIARQIYRDLAGRGVVGMVDWQVCDRYCLSATDFRAVIEASNGHLRLRQPGILEAVKLETGELTSQSLGIEPDGDDDLRVDAYK